ncbi:prominin-2 [Conger conger]|uniref:prominin-2 n=1 Tax=Conger conger TaxID=82655 RepID=UPI002A5A1B23|nr:prominin-2 [Conger conger]
MRVSIWLVGRWLFLWACLGARLQAGDGACPVGLTRPDLNGSQYQLGPGTDAGIGFLSGFVQSYLNTVQPNPFPKELLLELINDAGTATIQDTVNKVLRYEVGFLVCAAIGVLYIVLMPLVGFFFACCRCCGNCGGHMYQEQTKSTGCQRRGLYWALLCITIITLAGNVCMFRSNQSLAFSVQNSLTQSDGTLDNLQTYLAAVPQDVGMVVNESVLAVDEVGSRVNDFGRLVGEDLQKDLGSTLNPALDTVRNISQAVNSTIQLLGQLNATQEELRPELDTLEANLTATRDSVNRTFQMPDCQDCVVLQPELAKLTLDTSFTVPQLSELQSTIDAVVEADLDSRLKKGEELLANLPERVTNDTEDTVQNVQAQLKDIKKDISQLHQDIPLNALEDVSAKLEEVRGYISTYTPEVELAGRRSWIVGLVLSCAVLLVVLCNVLGLLLGPVGLQPKADPTKRSGTANCGGTFLMAGVGFSFLFSWIFMIVVLVLFLVGGNVSTLVCEPWQSQQIFQIIDTPGLIPGFQLSEALGLKTNLTIAKVYDDCQHDRSLWTTLHLQEVINLNDLLNASKYTEQIQQALTQNDITLPTITLLSPEERAQLLRFSSRAGSLDFSSAQEQLNNISRINLNTTADDLDTLADRQSDAVVEGRLRDDAARLRRIQAQVEGSILPKVRDLSSVIQVLEDKALKVNRTMGSVLSRVDMAQDFLNGNSSQIVKSAIQTFLDCQERYFTAFAAWANRTITEQVGRCGPLAGAVDTAEVLVCSYLAASLNAFWFSLGWCAIFLIPSLILSVKLAKFYRRMKCSDAFEDHIQMNQFPRASLIAY